MSIATEITRLNANKEALATAKTAIASAITNKGGTVASGDGFSDFATDIASIPSGGGITVSSWTIEFASYKSYNEFGPFVEEHLIGNANVSDLANAFTVKFVNNPETTRMGILANGVFYNADRALVRVYPAGGVVKRVGQEGGFQYGVDVAVGASAEITVYGLDNFVPIS